MTYLNGLDNFVTDCSKFFSVSPGLKVYDISVNQKNMRVSASKKKTSISGRLIVQITCSCEDRGGKRLPQNR